MLRHNWNEASAPPLQISCNISHLPEASCRPPEVLHMALPQTRSLSFLSDCLFAFRRNPAIAGFAGAAILVAATAIVNRHFAKKAQRDIAQSIVCTARLRLEPARRQLPEKAARLAHAEGGMKRRGYHGR